MSEFKCLKCHTGMSNCRPSLFWIINQVKEMAITRKVVKFAEEKTGSLAEQMTEKRILPEILQGYSRPWGKIMIKSSFV